MSPRMIDSHSIVYRGRGVGIASFLLGTPIKSMMIRATTEDDDDVTVIFYNFSSRLSARVPGTSTNSVKMQLWLHVPYYSTKSAYTNILSKYYCIHVVFQYFASTISLTMVIPVCSILKFLAS